MTVKAMKLASVLILGVAFSVGFSACSRTQTTPMSSATRVPGAEGQVVAEKIENGNTRLDITVKHLAHPEKIQASATTYVVWLLPNGMQAYQNIGALQVDNELNGKLTTTTPHGEFVIVITAEPFSQANAPTGPEVFKTTVRAQ